MYGFQSLGHGPFGFPSSLAGKESTDFWVGKICWKRDRCPLQYSWASLVAQLVKHCRRPGFDPWVGKIPWRREQLPTPVFWPGEFHGQRSLTGYSPWGHKESDTTEGFSYAHKYKYCYFPEIPNFHFRMNIYIYSQFARVFKVKTA